MLENYKNYGIYVDLIKESTFTIDVAGINKENWSMHFNNILNILRDGIETDKVQQSFVTVLFNSSYDIELSIIDYFVNLLLWKIIVDIGETIQPYHLVFEENFTRNTIKKYIDEFVIRNYRDKVSNIVLNNIINDCLSNFKYIEDFAYYLANTVNIEDDITLMNENKEFYDIVHADLSGATLEEYRDIADKLTNRKIELIKKSEHCLRPFFKANEAISPRQYREFGVNIGPKPDGRGSIYPEIINTNYLIGGLKSFNDYVIESSAGRTAQILSKLNTGTSGHFSRLLGLNNQDAFLNPDPSYVCNSTNFIKVTLKDKKIFERVAIGDRYYRLDPNGVEMLMTNKDTHLIGRTIYLRSPITCASAAQGKGICYRCYGKLAYINNTINVGKIAAEILTNDLTQKQLSAKHLLEAFVVALKWNQTFSKYFVTNSNTIELNFDNMDLKGYYIVIDLESITPEDEFDNFEYNDYITEFYIQDPQGNREKVCTDDLDNLYLTMEMTAAVNLYKKNAEEDQLVKIPCEDLENIPLFLIKIINNELSRTLELIKSIINKSAVTSTHDKDSMLQALLETSIEGKVDMASVHFEVLIMNQIRSILDILEKPDWSIRNTPYSILTLNQSLDYHPSVTVSMSYGNLSRGLYRPLTARKSAPSIMDLFFMKQPQKFINKEINSNRREYRDPNKIKKIFKFLDKNGRIIEED